MKSRHSTSLLVVWRVAEAEARHQDDTTIQPIHLLLGLCKVVDLDLPELISKNLPDRDEVLEELLREVRKLRTVFRVAGVDAKTLRRRLRRNSPDGRPRLKDSERLRRSSDAKEVFSDAEHFAQIGNSAVYPVHLLYATLLTQDKDRDATLLELGIRKSRVLSVTKRDALQVGVGSTFRSQAARTRWN